MTQAFLIDTAVKSCGVRCKMAYHTSLAVEDFFLCQGRTQSRQLAAQITSLHLQAVHPVRLV